MTAFGSATWEYYGETNYPSLNDLINTTLGGVALGEMFHRTAWLVRNPGGSGRGRLWNEIAAAVIDPITGANRFLTGDRSRRPCSTWWPLRSSGRPASNLAAVLEGSRQDGTVTIAGWIEIASRDSSLKTTFRSVDLLAVEPYLIRAGERGVRKGTLDLDLQSEVSRNRLHAPGQLTISGLELDPAAGRFGTFMGLPRDGVPGALKNQRGQISVSFVLEGNIDDPQFSLNEAFTTRLASSLAESLGISLGGHATGVGSMGQKGVEAVGEAAKGAMQQIFEDEKTR